MTGGLIIMPNCCGMPWGVNHNSFIVMINPPPPGAYHNGGVYKNLTTEIQHFRRHVIMSDQW